MELALMIVVLVVAALAVAMWISALQQKRSTDRLVAALLQPHEEEETKEEDFRAFEGLPEPVERYLRLALRDRQRPIRVALFEQVGSLRTDLRSKRWAAVRGDADGRTNFARVRMGRAGTHGAPTPSSRA